jgi:hypothetical protein
MISVEIEQPPEIGIGMTSATGNITGNSNG